jgi:hypothetical protein
MGKIQYLSRRKLKKLGSVSVFTTEFIRVLLYLWLVTLRGGGAP